MGFFLSFLQVKREFKNRIFGDLPQRIYELTRLSGPLVVHEKNNKKEFYATPVAGLPNFNAAENRVAIFVAALLVEMEKTGSDSEMLAKWRENSSGLPIREDLFTALDLIESTAFKDQKYALTKMKTLSAKTEERLVAALNIIKNRKTSPSDLFSAHIFITNFFINTHWEDFVVMSWAELLSTQWLEKTKFRTALKTPMLTVPQITGACNIRDVGKKKIGQILIAAYHAVSVSIPPDTLEQLRKWSESESRYQSETTGKNPIAQALIRAMEKPSHLTDEDIDILNRSIEEGKRIAKFASPFEQDESENNE